MNQQVFSNFQNTNSKIIAVTKYFDAIQTHEYIKELESHSELIVGFGENRIEQIVEKKIERKKLHFIGNIQSKKIPDIVKYCGVIHSISSEKYLRLCEKSAESQDLTIEIFLQLKLDKKKEIGFSENEIIKILKNNTDSRYLKIIGISGMGSGEFIYDKKVKEFQKLIDLRNSYFTEGLISAGTSRDYQLAVELGIDIVRIGQALFKKSSEN